jgi:hypothetical protein
MCINCNKRFESRNIADNYGLVVGPNGERSKASAWLYTSCFLSTSPFIESSIYRPSSVNFTLLLEIIVVISIKKNVTCRR